MSRCSRVRTRSAPAGTWWHATPRCDRASCSRYRRGDSTTHPWALRGRAYGKLRLRMTRLRAAKPRSQGLARVAFGVRRVLGSAERRHSPRQGYFSQRWSLQDAWDVGIGRYVKRTALGEVLEWGAGTYGTPRGIVSTWISQPRASSSHPHARPASDRDRDHDRVPIAACTESPWRRAISRPGSTAANPETSGRTRSISIMELLVPVVVAVGPAGPVPGAMNDRRCGRPWRRRPRDPPLPGRGPAGPRRPR